MLKIEIPQQEIQAFCRRWKVQEFSLFGSVLREDFGPTSDVDVLISFLPEAPWSLTEWVEMADELAKLFGRKVDLVEKEALRNPFRRERILTTKEVVYAG
ncbi:MAG: nucleotidyltransferase family protein [Coprothermobacterota bacterium]|nr:nucleotidyltransferase family protein [Coprothermobacterota bacterium]